MTNSPTQTSALSSIKTFDFAGRGSAGLDRFTQWLPHTADWLHLRRIPNPPPVVSTDVYLLQEMSTARIAHIRATPSEYGGILERYPTGSFVVVCFPTAPRSPKAVPRESPSKVLQDIARSTGMTRQDLASTFGVKLRTIYNWLAGSVAPDAVGRVMEFGRLLSPAQRWDTDELRNWLRSGSPTPLSLLIAGEWDQFGDLLAEGPRRRPLRTSSSAIRIKAGTTEPRRQLPDDEVDPQQLLQSMRAARRAAADTRTGRTQWVPHGLAETDDESAG